MSGLDLESLDILSLTCPRPDSYNGQSMKHPADDAPMTSTSQPSHGAYLGRANRLTLGPSVQINNFLAAGRRSSEGVYSLTSFDCFTHLPGLRKEGITRAVDLPLSNARIFSVIKSVTTSNFFLITFKKYRSIVLGSMIFYFKRIRFLLKNSLQEPLSVGQSANIPVYRHILHYRIQGIIKIEYATVGH